jgi:CxxC motif-containing protein (DUF1111 family)
MKPSSKLVLLATLGLLFGTTVAQVATRAPRPTLPPLVETDAGAGVQPGAAPGPAPAISLLGLDPASLAAFGIGERDFLAVETPEGGLGPAFNGRSCAECHRDGGTGGSGRNRVVRFGLRTATGFDPLTVLGGPLLQNRAIHPDALERVPAQANVVATRITTPLFGAGLIEAIADADIVRNAARRQPDGIQGRVSMVDDPASGVQRVGRFGWKAQHATLTAFSADAYNGEMGITNRLFPRENAPNGNAALLARHDRVPELEDAPDPGTGRSDFDRAADFMRFLAPPAVPARPSASALAGAAVFERLGCAACHLPVMNTGPHPVTALSGRTVALYSDLLLHDMGSLGDGIEQGGAGAREMRTAPLWGLRLRRAFLHDGRATTVTQAIAAHDGTAAPARARHQAASPLERQQLLDFLGTI